MRKILFQGTAWATLGALIIFCSALFVPVDVMAWAGWGIYATGFGLITKGLLPYRRLSMLERCPDKLLWIEGTCLEWHRKGRSTVILPLSIIEKMEYISEGTTYGILFTLKDSVTSVKMLFMPYFSRSAFDRLRSDLA